MKTIIKKGGAILCTLLLVLTACSDQTEELHADTDGKALELNIRMTGDFELDSRSELNTSEPTHHLEHLYAYLFTVPESVSGQPATDQASCIYEEKLPWQPSADAISVFRCKLKDKAYQAIENDNPLHQPDRKYLILVVGVDNNLDTYAFPALPSTATDRHLGMTGRKLKEVTIQLAQTADPARMSYTELFAGYQTFHTHENRVHIQLTRRVAGVLCYLKDIPAKVNDYHIIGVQLHCNGGLNRQGSLQPDLSSLPTGQLTPNAPGENQPVLPFLPLANDQKTTNHTLLAEINLKEQGAEADPNGSLLYIPPIQEEGVLVTTPNTVLLGAYLLPIQADAQFNIRLVGELRNAEGQVTGGPYVFTNKDTDGYYTVKNPAGQTLYPVKADYLYQIGTKPYAQTTDYDDPLSLKGKPITVRPTPWQSEKINVQFPNTQMGVVVGSSHLAAFKHNCMTTDDSLHVQVLTAQYEQTPWTLTIPGDVDWLHFITKNPADGQEVLKKEIRGTGSQKVRIRLSDHINPHSKNKAQPDEDYRWTKVVLRLEGSPMQSSTLIRQWNALIVQTWNEQHNQSWEIAFSRLDNGATFKNDGTLDMTQVETYPWNYHGIYPTSIFDGGKNNNTGDDGLSNHGSMYRERNQLINKGEWQNAVVNRSKREGWYLPARIEMQALIHKMAQVKSAFLLPMEQKFWWTATAVGGDRWHSYAARLEVQQEAEWWAFKGHFSGRTERHRARLAHKIPTPHAQP